MSLDPRVEIHPNRKRVHTAWQTVERDVQRQGQPREDLRQLRMFEFCDAPQLAAGSVMMSLFITGVVFSHGPLSMSARGGLWGGSTLGKV